MPLFIAAIRHVAALLLKYFLAIFAAATPAYAISHYVYFRFDCFRLRQRDAMAGDVFADDAAVMPPPPGIICAAFRFIAITAIAGDTPRLPQYAAMHMIAADTFRLRCSLCRQLPLSPMPPCQRFSPDARQQPLMLLTPCSCRAMLFHIFDDMPQLPLMPLIITMMASH